MKIKSGIILTLLLVMLFVFFYGYCRYKSLESGYYIPTNINVSFYNKIKKQKTDAKGCFFCEQYVSTTKNIMKHVYFHVTSKNVQWYYDGQENISNIVNNRVNINHIWYTTRSGFGDEIIFTSDEKSTCALFSCQMVFVLKKTDDNSQELDKLRQEYAHSLKAFQVKIVRERERFNNTVMPDFPGAMFSVVDGFSLKLPFYIQESTQERLGGIYRRKIGGLIIDKNDSGTTVYDYHDRPNQTDGELVVVSGKKNDFNMSSWLAGQRGIIFSSENGAVYYDQYGELEVIYIQFNASLQRYFIGLSHARSLDAAAKEFSFLRTMDPRYRGKKWISLSDIELSRSDLEDKYKTKVSELLNISDIENKIQRDIDFKFNLNKELKMKFNLSQTKNDSSVVIEPFRVAVFFMLDRDFDYINIAIFSESVRKLMDNAKRINPQGKLYNDFFVYQKDGDGFYYYYRSLGNGTTLRVTVPVSEDHMVERIFLLQALRQMDNKTFLPHTVTAKR
ncbi:hypothetical protein [Enterobacter sp. PTB]|uniref:hypothetical protein n=1 Tax=Enterobacter sp. PTB TaxID=3143437 RepID=UPI003DA7BB28